MWEGEREGVGRREGEKYGEVEIRPGCRRAC